MEHVLHMPTECLPRCVLSFEAGYGWKMVPGWPADGVRKSMKSLTGGLACVGTIRLPAWAPWVFTNRWLSTISDAAGCPSQWHSWVPYFVQFLKLLLCRQLTIIPGSFPLCRWCCEAATQIRACWLKVKGEKRDHMQTWSIKRSSSLSTKATVSPKCDYPSE